MIEASEGTKIINQLGRSPRRRRGFTLIELLIVVAIIAILAAIAVPNFLEAQTRAKISRAKADLRTVAMALETYRVDNNAYPLNDGVFNVLAIRLSSPIPYLTDSKLADPFNTQEFDPTYGTLIRFYTYDKIVDVPGFVEDKLAGYPPPNEAIDAAGKNFGALAKYGQWRLVSYGPDKKYSSAASFAATDPILLGSDILYDPSNGTISWGNILRTQVSPEGKPGS